MNKNAQASFPPQLYRKIAGIEGDNVHGAGYLALKCLDLMADAAVEYAENPSATGAFDEFLRTLAARLTASQSAMFVIPNLLARVLERFFSESGPRPGATARNVSLMRRIVEEEKQRLEHDMALLAEKGSSFLAGKLPPGGHIVTISHSRAVFGVLKGLAAACGVRVSVAESRPLNEGVELARQLADLGISVRLIPDCLLGLATAEADAALIGADSLPPGGDVVNKAGTRLLALAANADGVPVYCCAETLKVMTCEPGPETPFPVQRERPAAEIVDPQPEGVEVLNLYFDRTDSKLIAGYITELGILNREKLKIISSEAAGRLRKNIRLD